MSPSTRQNQILAFIRKYHAEHRFMPSVRDIQAACDISSTSVVDYNLRILQRDGYVRRADGISRGLELTHDTDAPAARAPEVFSVPLLGNIAAGAPLPVATPDGWQSEDAERVSLPLEMTPRGSGELFALRVKGQSMIDALIDDGDVVVLRAARTANNGEMVAAWLVAEEETTLKRIYFEGERVRLEPANTQMRPIVVPANNVQVHGKLVAVMRRLD